MRNGYTLSKICITSLVFKKQIALYISPLLCDLYSILPGRVLSFRHYSFKLGFTKSKCIKQKPYSKVYREKFLYFHEGLHD